MTSIRDSFRHYGLYFAWLVALAATLGSLYLSEIMMFEPCKYCWLQRIFMYPLAIILGIAAFKQHKMMIPYALALSIPGGLLALYHYLYQMIPALKNVAKCGSVVPCHLDHLNWFGWLNIPLMSFVAFLLITVSLLLARSDVREAGQDFDEAQ